ncbi:uncharacterized protein LOC127714841 isoform X3 [Mytilus californianus]|uniref:uncharacterized protein LOC127714841 isoform X1 n=1 Tax=Mytilus californianus TaxID=6549 RepID=UPI0022458939|nr:uncharacterized protein LOC127714841 isoform X1 [Mytilus californianus]XP_052076837.1 uncharacterized protein LOC127714841 isoform X3 [Mytilus californianus]
MSSLMRLLVIFMYHYVIDSQPSTLTCPAGWNSLGLKCYKMSHQSLTFWNAKEYCNNQNAEVIMPKTAEENNAMKTLLRQVNSTKKWHGIWIGLTDTESEGTWLWTDGTKLISANNHWSPETYEPNGFTKENCVVGHTRTEKWIDIACYSEHRAVCQLKDVTVNEGESVQLTCGVNNMQISWTRSVKNTSVKVSEYTNGVSLTNLVFDNVKWSDEGNYECSFTSIDGLPETKITRLFVNTSTKMCNCRCDYRRKLEYWESTIQRNQTKTELYKKLEHVIRQIQDELKVNKTMLSSTTRKLTSAYDNRKLSQTIGFVGAVFISVVVGLVVFIDIIKFKQHIENIWKKYSSKR